MLAGRKPPWRAVIVLALVLAALVVGLLSRTGKLRPAAPAPTPPLPSTPAPRPPAAWLGLNYNSGSGVGSLKDFSARGIVYDREGMVEARSGWTPANRPGLGSALAQAYRAGLVPDVEVDPASGSPGCTSNPIPRKICLPTGPRQISSYVQGFVATARSIIDRFPHRQVLLEPTDEPWDWASPPGTTSGRRAAGEYAALLAALLPAARAAGVPLSDIYVPATGRLDDGSSWIPDLYAAAPCLKPGPGTCGPIAGWNIHPYGLPHRTSEGIGLVPHLRAQMQSGQGNLIVSEIGFCAINVQRGKDCHLNRPDVVGSSAQTARWLRATLEEAAPMHRAGWLRALLVWERASSGWAMQNPDGSLTAQGRVLDLFAATPAGR